MNRKKIKLVFYSFVPNKYRGRVKSLYYDLLKLRYNLRSLFRYGMWDFSDTIAIETTTHCNLRCKFCPNSKYDRGIFKKKKLMDSELFKKIINELSQIRYKGQILLHFYGEPLTDKRLPDLIDYTNKKLPRASIQINTNGLLLTLAFYKKLIKNGVKCLFITQYAKTMPSNLKTLFSYLKTRPKKENKIIYRVLGEDLPLSNRGGEINVKNVGDFVRPICLHPRNAVNIDYGGNMILCCNDYHSSIKFGNLREEKFLNIWNKPFYKKLRRELRKKSFKLSICKKCVGLE